MPGNILDPNLTSCKGLETIVCMPESELAEQVIDELLELECKVYQAKSPEDAIAKIQFQLFCIVIIQEGYSMEIMQLLAFLPMISRRNLFYIVLGDSFETGNQMQSYVLSSNLVLNTTDVPYLNKLLFHNIMENNYFYRQFYHAIQS